MDIEWFASVADVPGVEWSAPTGFERSPQFADALPVVEGSDDWQYLSWRVTTGRSSQRLKRSPVELVGPSPGAEGSIEDLIVSTCAALQEPGTRYDYFDLLTLVAPRLPFLTDYDARGAEWAERFDQLAVQLVRGDLYSAVSYGLGDEVSDRRIQRALQPFQSIVQRYVREGFLLEAVPVYLEMKSLAGSSAPDYLEGFDPRPAIAALQELAR